MLTLLGCVVLIGAILEGVVRFFLLKSGLFLQACPKVTAAMVNKYKTFDAQLGWKPNPVKNHQDNTGSYIGLQGNTTYSIDDQGSRTFSGAPTYSYIATFGDSFCMCREVNDTETIQYHLSQFTQSYVTNYGVGNYGLDQALLRLESMNLSDSVHAVVMILTPWTIERTLSVWLHYANPGNVLAVKPRFILSDGLLKLVKSPLQSPNDFLHLKRYQDFFRQQDGNAPYFFAQLKKAPKTALGYVVKDGDLLRCLLASTRVKTDSKNDRSIAINRFLQEAEPYLLKTFQRKNDYLQGLYEKQQDLLFALLKRFVDVCQEKGRRPYCVMLPAYTHVRYMQDNHELYRAAFDRICAELNLSYLDLYAYWKSLDDVELQSLYVDKYGHHSVTGNQRIAGIIHQQWFGKPEKISK